MENKLKYFTIKSNVFNFIELIIYIITIFDFKLFQ